MTPVRQPQSSHELDPAHLSLQGGNESSHMWGFMRGYMWRNGHFATREGHYHPIGGDLNDRLRLNSVVNPSLKAPRRKRGGRFILHYPDS